MIPLTKLRLESAVRSLTAKYREPINRRRRELDAEISRTGYFPLEVQMRLAKLKASEKRIGVTATLTALVRIGLRYAEEHPELMEELIISEDLVQGRSCSRDD
jgi:hypothetical protein